MNLERVRLRTCVLRPYGFSQLRVCDETASVAHESSEDAELDPGQSERPASALRDTLAQVQRHIPDHQSRAPVASMAPDNRFHASHQLLQSEGLPDIIVGA